MAQDELEQANVEPPTSPPETVEADGGDWIPYARRSTRQVFGAYVARLRGECHLSAEVFLAKMRRTPEWLASLDRGELALTKNWILDMEVAFQHHGRDLDLVGDFSQFEYNPYGERAREIVTDYQLPIQFDEPPPANKPGGGISPVVASVGHRDRLLLFGPALSFLSLLIVGTANFRAGLDDSFQANLPLALFGAASLLTLAVFALGDIEKGSQKLALLSRTRAVHDMKADLDVWRDGAGLKAELGHSQWFTESDVEHLLPRKRNDVVELAQFTELCERFLTPLASLFVLSQLATTALAVHGDPATRFLLQALLTLLLAGSALLVHNRRTVAASQYLNALFDAIGEVEGPTPSSEVDPDC